MGPLVGALLVLLAAAGTADAQITAGLEATRERARYRFENPSNFDTDFLVPHFFEQTYVLDNVWLTGTARYRAGVDWETTGGITTTSQARATDYDTFFNPGGVTWVAGTTGDARIRSWRIGQQVEIGRIGDVTFTGGYRLRVDTADFLAGDRTEVRNGVLIRREIVTTREYTRAQRHEIHVGARLRRAVSPRWSWGVTADVAPAAVHRLAIELPDKYPGVTLAYQTTALTAEGRAELHRDAPWSWALWIDGATTFNYSRAQRVHRTRLAAGTSFGRRW